MASPRVALIEAVLGATDSGQVIVLCPTLEDELRPASRSDWWRNIVYFGKNLEAKVMKLL